MTRTAHGTHTSVGCCGNVVVVVVMFATVVLPKCIFLHMLFFTHDCSVLSSFVIMGNTTAMFIMSVCVM